jgi:uncharacterized membrane protein
MKRSTWFVVLWVSVAGVSALAAEREAAKDIYHGAEPARLDALAAIQPGLGTVMTEYGNRFTDAYFAAKGGNWGLAQYQLKEMVEIQEVGEITRPAMADVLKSFESAYLEPLAETVKQKDFAAFEKAFGETVAGCNGCHAGTGNSFVRYVLPQKPGEAYLDFTLKTEPTDEEKKK